MDVFDYTEFIFLLAGLYYIYFVIRNYRIMNNVPVLRGEYKTKFLYSFIGSVGILLSFQVYYFTSFYKNHPAIETLIKIVLGISSILTQMLISEFNGIKNKKMMGKKKDMDAPYLERHNKNWPFKIINRLYLLNLIFKPFIRRKLIK